MTAHANSHLSANYHNLQCPLLGSKQYLVWSKKFDIQLSVSNRRVAILQKWLSLDMTTRRSRAAFILTLLVLAQHVESNQWRPAPFATRSAGANHNHQSTALETTVDLPHGGGDESDGKGASLTASVFNLVNNVAGAGILTLPAGMASGTGLIPAMAICAVLGLLSGHSFSIIGEACELTGEADFKVCSSMQFYDQRSCKMRKLIL